MIRALIMLAALAPGITLGDTLYRYSYTGALFDYVSPDLGYPVDRLTGYVDLADPLPAASGTLIEVDPVSYWFTDGYAVANGSVLAYNKLYAAPEFRFWTVGGQIADWSIQITYDPATVWAGRHSYFLSFGGSDQSYYCRYDYDYCVDQMSAGVVDFENYSWSMSTVQVVPLPSAAWLLGSSLGLAAWLRRRSSLATLESR